MDLDSGGERRYTPIPGVHGGYDMSYRGDGGNIVVLAGREELKAGTARTQKYYGGTSEWTKQICKMIIKNNSVEVFSNESSGLCEIFQRQSA